MTFSPRKLNSFLLVKLPSAWFCGVRVKEITSDRCITGVTHRWINQNPFNSLYFAVQAMAAELSTGALVMKAIQEKNKKISMLVAQNSSEFHKKATGKIRFTCNEGAIIENALQKAIDSGEGQTFWMESTGHNQEGQVVSVFRFQWTVKLKTNR